MGNYSPFYNNDWANNYLQNDIERDHLQGLEPNGTVIYKQCIDDVKVFILNTDNTTNTPDPVTKGTDISFNLAGTLDDIVNVTQVNIHVDYLTTVYYDNTTNLSFNYNTTSVNIPQTWTLPSDAPPGTYDITFTFIGSAKGKAGKVICVFREMNLT